MPEPCGPRYAIYYTPAREHPLTVAASSWLGRDAFSADPIEDARPQADVRLSRFAASQSPCPIGSLIFSAASLRSFPPVPSQPCGFAAQTVEEFDRFRAPMDGDDLERRMSRQLDEVETTNFVTWAILMSWVDSAST